MSNVLQKRLKLLKIRLQRVNVLIFSKYLNGTRPSGPPLQFNLLNKTPKMEQADKIYRESLIVSNQKFLAQQQEKTRQRQINPVLLEIFSQEMI